MRCCPTSFWHVGTSESAALRLMVFVRQSTLTLNACSPNQAVTARSGKYAFDNEEWMTATAARQTLLNETERQQWVESCRLQWRFTANSCHSPFR